MAKDPKAPREPKLAERPFRVGDRVIDVHGREGLIINSEGDYFLVAFVSSRQMTRTEISYYPNDEDIKAITAELRAKWSPDIEEKKSQYPTQPATIPDYTTNKRGGRRINKREVQS